MFKIGKKKKSDTEIHAGSNQPVKDQAQKGAEISEYGRVKRNGKLPAWLSTFISNFKAASRGRKILTVLVGLFAVGVLSVLIMVGVTAIQVGSVNMDSLYSNIEQSSTLYDVNGEKVDTLHYTQNRTITPIEDMPDDLKNAFIAIEDKTFYKHHGFNFRRMIGAVLSSFTGGGRISGTSTITQQLARNAYLADIKSQRSIHRKLSEMYIAWRLEHKLTKDEILEAYLNTIYLGYGNYGVGAAARTYYSKDVSDLTLAECASLAALPQAPDAYALVTTEPGDGNAPIEKVTYYSLDDLNDVKTVDGEDEENKDEDSYETSSYDSDEDSEDAENGDENEGTGFYANDVSKDRRNTVLSLMEQQGYITESQASEADVDIIDILAPSFENSDSAYTYFTDYVSGIIIKDLIEKYDMSEEEALRMVYTGGLKIYTTINSDIQNAIYNEFQDDSNFPTAVDDSKVQASMVVTEVGTGYISGFVGGRDAGGSQLFNRAISPRQPGSSIKPLSVYGAALQKSYELSKKHKKYTYIDYDMDSQGTKGWGDYITASSTVVDEPLMINGEEWPQNVTRTFSGYNTFREALQQSINTCAVKILWQVGLDYSVETLKNFGITTVVDDVSNPVNDVNPAALGLGAMTEGVTPLEMALAYAAFPNGGVRNEAVCYTRVVDSKDKELLTGGYKEHKVLDSGVAWIMTDLLKSVVSDGIAGNARISGVEVGGKTGTTNDKYDVWFDGFTPDYAAALWIGTDLNVEMDGGSYQAARLWSRIMKQVPGITDGEYREMPANVVEKDGEYYTKGTEENLSEYIDYDDDDDDSGSDEDADEAKRKAAEEAAKKKAEEDAAKKAAQDAANQQSNPGSSTDSGGGSSSGGTDSGGTDSGGGSVTPDPSGGGGTPDQSGGGDNPDPSGGGDNPDPSGGGSGDGGVGTTETTPEG